MSKTGFDFDEFIESVRPFTFLYDRNCPEFKDTALKSRKWQAIGEQYGISAPDAQKKWANLKDKYMRLKKEWFCRCRNGEGSQLPKWAFYRQMDDVYSAINGGGTNHSSPMHLVFESNSSALSWQDNISIHEEASGNSCESPLPHPSITTGNGRIPDTAGSHKRRQTEDDIVHCIQSSTQVLQELSSLKRPVEDGPHHFCMWIAERMRNLSQMKQYKLQHAIHNALTHIELEDDES